MAKTDKEIKDGFKAATKEYYDHMKAKIDAKKAVDKAAGKAENPAVGKAEAMLDGLKKLIDQL